MAVLSLTGTTADHGAEVETLLYVTLATKSSSGTTLSSRNLLLENGLLLLNWSITYTCILGC